MTYTPEQRAADGEIAKVIGWTEVEMSPFGEWEGKTPNERKWALIPRLHESHDARAALLEWLKTKDEALQEKFVCAALRQIGGDLYDRYQVDRGFYADQMIAIMAATPAQVAEAALRVIKEGNE